MVQQFKYKVINTLASGVPMAGPPSKPQAERIQKRLDQLGKQGWELCAVESTLFVFKKRVVVVESQ